MAWEDGFALHHGVGVPIIVILVFGFAHLTALVPSNVSDATSYAKYFGLLRTRGTAIMVGAPEELLQIGAGFLLGGEKQIVGSSIGSVAVIKDMLKLCAEKNVVPLIQEFPLSKCNEAIKTVRDNTIRFRAVLTVDEQRDWSAAKL